MSLSPTRPAVINPPPPRSGALTVGLTSNIDSQTELLVQQARHKLLAGRTSLVIAHRLSTIRAADEVLALDDGRVVERGTHHEMLRKRGYYFKLYQQQFAELVPA